MVADLVITVLKEVLASFVGRSILYEEIKYFLSKYSRFGVDHQILTLQKQ